MSRDDTFLQRWSRRKVEAAGRKDHKHPPAADAVAPGNPAAAEPHGDRTAEDGPLDLSKIDISKLDRDSDYTVFMQKGVPEDMRNEALRKLWTSDPIFSVIDGLDDYCEDFTDAACVTPDLKTAYRIGRGFLSDEEVAEWERLGKPVEKVPGAEAGEVAAADGSETASADVTAGASGPQPSSHEDTADAERADPADLGDTASAPAPTKPA